MRVVPPIVAVACTVYVPAGVPLGGGVLLPPPRQDDSSRRLSATIGRNTRDFLSRGRPKDKVTSASKQAIAIGNVGNRRCEPGCAIGVIKLRAIVVTFTVKGTAAVPTRCNRPRTAPFAHPNVTVPVNPFTALNCSAIEAVCPAVTVAEVFLPLGGAIWKSVAVPVNVAAGFVLALPLRVRPAVRTRPRAEENAHQACNPLPQPAQTSTANSRHPLGVVALRDHKELLDQHVRDSQRRSADVLLNRRIALPPTRTHTNSPPAAGFRQAYAGQPDPAEEGAEASLSQGVLLPNL